MRRFAKVDVPRLAAPANLVWCAGFVLAAQSSTSRAAVDLTPYAGVSYAYQSNPLYQWNGASTDLAVSSASLLKLEGGGDARFTWSRQTLTANAGVRRFEYENLGYLQRTEETLAGKYEWSPTSDVVAGGSYRYDHRMVPFEELGDSREKLMETERAAGALLNLQLPRAWEARSRLDARDILSPRPGVPDLSLHETSFSEALRRAHGTLSLGVDGEYRSGSYHGAGAPSATTYQQVTVQLASERSIAGFSNFSSALGYTKRKDTPGTGVSTVTGFIRYERNITGKTSGEVFIRRAVNSYITGTSSEIDTGVGMRAAWQPTVRIRAEVSLALTRSELPGSGGAASPSRRDRYGLTTIQLRYQVFNGLSVGPYGRYALRSSNEPAFGFNAKEFGIELVFREPR